MLPDLFEELEQGNKPHHGFYRIGGNLIHLNIVENHSTIEIPHEILLKVYEEMGIDVSAIEKKIQRESP